MHEIAGKTHWHEPTAGKRAGGKGNEQGLLDAAQTRNRASGVRLDGQYRARSLRGGEASST